MVVGAYVRPTSREKSPGDRSSCAALGSLVLRVAKPSCEVVRDRVGMLVWDGPDPNAGGLAPVGGRCIPHESRQPTEKVSSDALALEVRRDADDDEGRVSVTGPTNLDHTDFVASSWAVQTRMPGWSSSEIHWSSVQLLRPPPPIGSQIWR